MTDHLQFVALTFSDGTLGVMQFLLTPRVSPEARPVGHDRATGRREASDQAIESEIARSAFDGRAVVSWRRIQFGDVPTDRRYRDAWRDRGGRIEHDMQAARAIVRDRLRRLRAPKLAALDVDYQRADEANDAQEKRRIVALKQKLRDLPADARIDAAQSVADFEVVLTEAR